MGVAVYEPRGITRFDLLGHQVHVVCYCPVVVAVSGTSIVILIALYMHNGGEV